MTFVSSSNGNNGSGVLYCTVLAGVLYCTVLYLQVYPLNRPFYAFDHENGSRPDLSCWVGFVSHFTDKLYR